MTTYLLQQERGWAYCTLSALLWHVAGYAAGGAWALSPRDAERADQKAGRAPGVSGGGTRAAGTDGPPPYFAPFFSRPRMTSITPVRMKSRASISVQVIASPARLAPSTTATMGLT